MDTVGDIIDLDVAAEVELDETGLEISSKPEINKTKSNMITRSTKNNETKVPIRLNSKSTITIRPGNPAKRLKRVLPTKPTRPTMLGNLSFREIAGKRKNMSKISETKTDHNNVINLNSRLTELLENDGKIENKDNSQTFDTRKLIGKTVRLITKSSQDISIKFVDKKPPDLLKNNQKLFRIKADVLFNKECISNGLSEKQTVSQKPKENSLKSNDNYEMKTSKVEKQSLEFPNLDSKTKYVTQNCYLNVDDGTNKPSQNYNFEGIARNRNPDVDNKYNMNINNYKEETGKTFQNMAQKDYHSYLLPTDIRTHYSDLNDSMIHMGSNDSHADLSILSELASTRLPLPIDNPTKKSPDIVKESVKTFREIGVNTDLYVTDFSESEDDRSDRSTEKQEELDERPGAIKTTVNSKRQKYTPLKKLWKTKSLRNSTCLKSGSFERKGKQISPWCLQYTSSLPDILKTGNYRKESKKNNTLHRKSDKILHHDYRRGENEKKIPFHKPAFTNNSVSKNYHHRNVLVPHKHKHNLEKHCQPINHSNVKTKSSLEVITLDHETSSLEENLSLDTEEDDDISIIKEVYISSPRDLNSLSRPNCAFLQNRCNEDNSLNVNKQRMIKITKVGNNQIYSQKYIKKEANKSLIQAKVNRLNGTARNRAITVENSKSNRICKEETNISTMRQLQIEKNDLVLDMQEKENNNMSIASEGENLLYSPTIRKCCVILERLDLSNNKYSNQDSARGVLEVTNTVVNDNSILLNDGKCNSINIKPLHVRKILSKSNLGTIKKLQESDIVGNPYCGFDCVRPEQKITNPEGNNMNTSPVSNQRVNGKRTENEIKCSVNKGKGRDMSFKVIPNTNFQNVKKTLEEMNRNKLMNQLPLNRETQAKNSNITQRKVTIQENMTKSEQNKPINIPSTNSSIALVKSQHDKIDTSGFCHDDRSAESNSNMDNNQHLDKNDTLSKTTLAIKVVLEKLNIVENLLRVGNVTEREQKTSITEDNYTPLTNVQSSQGESGRVSDSDVNFCPALKKCRGRPKKISPNKTVQEMETSDHKHKSSQSPNEKKKGKNLNANMKNKTSIKDNLDVEKTQKHKVIDKKSQLKTDHPEKDQYLPYVYDTVREFNINIDNSKSFNTNDILTKPNVIKNNILLKDNIVENHLTKPEEKATITENNKTNITKVKSNKGKNKRLTDSSVNLGPAMKKARGRPKKKSHNKTSQISEDLEVDKHNNLQSLTEKTEGKNSITNTKLNSSIKDNLSMEKAQLNKNDQSLPCDYDRVGEGNNNIHNINIESFEINSTLPKDNIVEDFPTIPGEKTTITKNNNKNVTKRKNKSLTESGVNFCPAMKKGRGRPNKLRPNNTSQISKGSNDDKNMSLQSLDEKSTVKNIMYPTMKEKRIGKPRKIHPNNKIKKLKGSDNYKQTSLLTHQETQEEVLNNIESKLFVTESLCKKAKIMRNSKKIRKMNSIKKNKESINELSGSYSRRQVLQSDNKLLLSVHSNRNKKKYFKMNKGKRSNMCSKPIQKHHSPTIAAENKTTDVQNILKEPYVSVEQLNYVNDTESKLKYDIQSVVSNKVDDSLTIQDINLKKIDFVENQMEKPKSVKKFLKVLKQPIKALNRELISEAPNNYKTRMCTTQQLRKLRSSPLKDTSLNNSIMKKSSTNSSFDSKYKSAKSKKKQCSNGKTKFIRMKSNKKTQSKVKITCGKNIARKDFSNKEDIIPNDHDSVNQNIRDKSVKNINSDNTDATKVSNCSKACDKIYLDSVPLSECKKYENEQHAYSESQNIINIHPKESVEHENQNNIVQSETLTYSNFDVLNQEMCSTPVINKVFSDGVMYRANQSCVDDVPQVKNLNCTSSLPNVVSGLSNRYCESTISSGLSNKEKENNKPTGLTKSLSELSNNSNQIPTTKGKMSKMSFSRYKHNKLNQNISLQFDSKEKHIDGVFDSISKHSENEYVIPTDTMQSYEASRDSLLQQLNSPDSSGLEESRVNRSEWNEAKSSNTNSRTMIQEELVGTFPSCQNSLETGLVPKNLFEDDSSTTLSITNVQSLRGTESMSIFDQLHCSDTTETVPESTVTDGHPVMSKKLLKIMNKLASVQRCHTINIKHKS